jgi:hypothetical protein
MFCLCRVFSAAALMLSQAVKKWQKPAVQLAA